MPSQTLIQEALAPETAAVLLTLLTIKIDNEPVLRLVKDNVDCVSNGETFTACDFNCILPDQGEGGNKSCRLQIDNTDISIYKTIKQATRGQKKITVEVAVILNTNPDFYEQGPFTFILRNINVSVNNITGELYDSYMADRKFTNKTYNPTDFPGMFF